MKYPRLYPKRNDELLNQHNILQLLGWQANVDFIEATPQPQDPESTGSERQSPSPAKPGCDIPPCPYRGLFAFWEEDAEVFFGRESLFQLLKE